MKYEVIKPPKELKNYVSHYWVGTWDITQQDANSKYYVIASSLTEITFAFRNNNRHSELLFSAAQGQTDQPNQIPVDGFCHLLGVAIYSYAVPSLFNISSSELNREFISLNTFLGRDGNILSEKIALANTSKERINILSNYLKMRLNKTKFEDKLITNAIKHIEKCNGNTNIEKLAEDHFLSHKQFKRRFKEYSGFNPKLYARIIRFESLIKNHTKFATLTKAAHALGYYDQAHFIREFKYFSGFSPLKFWELGK